MVSRSNDQHSFLNPLYVGRHDRSSTDTKAAALTTSAHTSWISTLLRALGSTLRSVSAQSEKPSQTPSTPLAKSLKDLNQTTNSRYDTTQVANRLILKFKDSGKILKALNHLMADDIRFNGKDPSFKIDPKIVAALRAALNSTTAISKREACDEKVGLLGQVLRLLGLARTAKSSIETINPLFLASKSARAHPLLARGTRANTGLSTVSRSSSLSDDSSLDSHEDLGDSDEGDDISSDEESVRTFDEGLDLPNSPSSEGTQSPVESPSAKSEKKFKKFAEEVGHDLVGLLIREEVTCTVGDLEVTQKAGHVEYGEGSLTPTFQAGRTISAEIQKKETTVGELANHAVLRDGAGRVILSRSARSDTPQKIEAKSVADIQERLADPARTGLRAITETTHGVERTIYVYERSDVTLMDTARLKAAGTILGSSFKSTRSLLQRKGSLAIENERSFVANKRQATQELFKDARIDASNGRRFIDREFLVGGERQTVREYEPMVFNFVFSSQADSPDNVRQARQDNIPSSINLFRSYISTHSDALSLDTYKDLLSADRTKELVAQLKIDMESDGSPDTKLALKAMLVALTGECLVDGEMVNFDNKKGTHVQFMLLCHLSPALTVECKSGNDRTILAIALACAQRALSRLGAPFDPTRGITQSLKDHFNLFLVGLGKPNLVASRGIDKTGKAEVKIKRSPVYKLLTEGVRNAKGVIAGGVIENSLHVTG